MFFIIWIMTMLACNFSATPTLSISQSAATVVAGTLQAITTVAPTRPPQGIKVSFKNVSLVIPVGLGNGANTNQTEDVEMPPYPNPSSGPMPKHIVITIKGYPIASPVVSQAKIAIFKASEYAGYSNITPKAFSELQSYRGGKVPPDWVFDAITIQASPTSIQNGHGVRYITQMIPSVQISNDQIYYYYQGITNDQAYFVMAVFPVNASFLPSNYSDQTVPPSGIPFPGITNPSASQNDLQAYYKAVEDKLNSTSQQDFKPPLSTLDALMQSIEVNP